MARASGVTLSRRPDCVRRVGDDRQVGEFVDDRDGGDVERVARVGLEGADAALAEDDVVVAAGQDVFGRQQPLLNRRRHAALEQDRLADLRRAPTAGCSSACCARRPAGCPHTRASLRSAQISMTSEIDGHVELVARRAQQFQSFHAHALKGIRRGARLVGAAAQHARAGPRHAARGLEELTARSRSCTGRP